MEYGNSVDRGFEWEYYSFEDPYNPVRQPSYQRQNYFQIVQSLYLETTREMVHKSVNCNILLYFG